MQPAEVQLEIGVNDISDGELKPCFNKPIASVAGEGR
jgi:hypothetical protein